MSEHDHNHEVLAPTPGERAINYVKRKEVMVPILLGVFFTAVFAVLGAHFYPEWMPEEMSKDMSAIEKLMQVFTYISAPVCGVVLGVAAYTFMNRKTGDVPPEDGPAIRTNGPVVIVWTVISSILALTAVVYGIVELNVGAQAAVADSKNAMVVNVVGNQWVWNFEYPAQGVNSNILELPVNQPVVFHVVSKDVNHSFWPVQLGVKVDANRIAETTAETTPTKLGVFDVKCAELCGIYHAYMETSGKVVTADEFNTWITNNGGHVA
jgi:cytochrome c oxidase subunit II